MTASTALDVSPGPDSGSRLWSVDEVAAYLQIPVATLYQWRSHGRGPLGRRIGRYLRYRPEDVRAWVDGLPTDVVT